MKTLFFTAAILAAASVSACGGSDGPEVDLQSAYDKCTGDFREEDRDFERFRVADGGNSIIVEDAGAQYDYVRIPALVCVLRDLGASEALLQKIGQSTTGSGSQEEQLDGVTVSWLVALSSGNDQRPALQVVIEKK